MAPCVVRAWSRSLNRSKTRTVGAAGGLGREGRERERTGRRAEQRKNKATALKEIEADLKVPWH